MRLVLQRVSRASVSVSGEELGSIGPGWAILVGIGKSDDSATVSRMVEKVAKLRAFEDRNGKTNLSAEDVGAEFLIVSQFSLYADTSRGRRPSFLDAAEPPVAEPLVREFGDHLRRRGFVVATGQFGAFMAVELVNSGPMTILLASDSLS
jgi:D-tyrosyl-tRNA(Tyr) deacylase